jgi:hypothetical protein
VSVYANQALRSILKHLIVRQANSQAASAGSEKSVHMAGRKSAGPHTGTHAT